MVIINVDEEVIGNQLEALGKWVGKEIDSALGEKIKKCDAKEDVQKLLDAFKMTDKKPEGKTETKGDEKKEGKTKVEKEKTDFGTERNAPGFGSNSEHGIAYFGRGNPDAGQSAFLCRSEIHHGSGGYCGCQGSGSP